MQAFHRPTASQLDFHERYHAKSHDQGPEVIDWFLNAAQVCWLISLQAESQYACSASFTIMQVLPSPALPVGGWPKNLVVGYVGGYTYEASPLQ